MSVAITILDYCGVAVFAVSGALVASRKQLDIVGFMLFATVTGVGGGTLRDLLLNRAINWVISPEPLGVCILAGIVTFILAPIIQRRFIVLIWLDAAGLALFSVLGTEIALNSGVHPFVAITMGVMSATFGGIMRDVIGNELPLILRKELYVSCAAAGAVIYLVCDRLDFVFPYSIVAGFAACFLLRSLGIIFNLSLPAYKNRPGRDYPDPNI